MRLTPTPARPVRRALAALSLVTTLVLGSGCIYRMPIQQGNVLDPVQVAQLEKGMTRSQVMFLLGTPMVPNGFDTERWDYYYYVQAGRKLTPYSKRLTVYFKDEKVDRFERSDEAAQGPATPGVAETMPGEPVAAPPPAVAPSPAPAPSRTPGMPSPGSPR